MNGPTTYTFGRTYQVKLLAMICRDSSFLLAHRDVVRPAYFEDPTLADICRVACDYFDKMNAGPTLPAIIEALEDIFRADPRREKKREGYDKVIKQIAGATLEEESDVTERAVRFAKTQSMVQAVLESADLIEAGKLEEVRPVIDEAYRVGESRTDIGLNYLTSPERLHESRDLETISTGIPDLDRVLYGGPAKKELAVVEAPPGRFKTGTLVNFGTAALKRGCDVVHGSFEVRRSRVARRYDGALLGMSSRVNAIPEIEAKLMAYRDSLSGRLFIQDYQINRGTVEMFRAYIYTLLAKKLIDPSERPLLLIADYGQIIKPERFYDSKRHEHRETYQALIRLAQEFDCPLWTAVQSTRHTVNKSVITIADLSECFAIAADADIIISLCQTEEEQELDAMRIYTAKVREAQSFREVEVDVDYELTRFAQTTDLARIPPRGFKSMKENTGRIPVRRRLTEPVEPPRRKLRRLS